MIETFKVGQKVRYHPIINPREEHDGKIYTVRAIRILHDKLVVWLEGKAGYVLAESLSEVEGEVITGKVVLDRDENSNGDCICCEGKHVYAQGLELEKYQGDWKILFNNNIDRWIQTVFDFKKLEGKTIEIIARVVD